MNRQTRILFWNLIFACAVAGRVSAACPPGNNFSFATFSDNYGGQEGALQRTFDELLTTDPGIQFMTSDGDTPSFQRIRGFVDSELTGNSCANNAFPWFPATGNHDEEDAANMSWWTANWATNWSASPQTSRLAAQLPGLTNFKRGPTQVRQNSALISVDPGTMYSFDYKNVHFLFINSYEQYTNNRGGYSDPGSGVFDYNGSATSDPTNSQLDWIEQDLKTTTQPIKFVFGHVAASAPLYINSGCNPPLWSEHDSDFHMAELTALMVKYNVTAYYNGHDHALARTLLDTNRNILYKRWYCDAAGPASGWQNKQGPGSVWQIDSGGLFTSFGDYVVTQVSDTGVTFKLYEYPTQNTGSTRLWDSWTIPIGPVTPPSGFFVDPTISPAFCATYNAITRSCTGGPATAYKDLNAASGAVNPGDTVQVRGGTYTNAFVPQKSGTPGNYITFVAYNNETVTMTGSGLDPAIDFSNRQYLVIDSFTVTNVGSWFLGITNMSNTIWQNNKFSGPVQTFTAGSIRDSTYNQFLKNSFTNSNGDSLTLFHSDHNLIQGNIFSDAAHSLYSIKCSNFNVVRGNILSNTLQKGSEVFDCDGSQAEMPVALFDATKHNFIEANAYLKTAPDPGSDPYSHIQYAGQEGVIRGNLFYGSQGEGVELTQYSTEADHTTHNRVYNNTFHANAGGGVVTANGSVSAAGYTDNIIKNNIFYKNTQLMVQWLGQLGGSQLTHRIAGGFLMDSNSLFGAAAGDISDIYWGPAGTTQSVSTTQNQNPTFYVRNIDADPSFVNSAGFDYHLNANSPVVDKGAFLTTTRSAGSGTSLPVADARYFRDSFGISGLIGDLIQLAGQTQTATVTAIDYTNNNLTLSNSMTWTANQGVSLAYNGAAPDPGALESGVSGGSSACDLNNDGVSNINDIQLTVNQAIGATPCTNADINQDGSCNVIDVQRVVNAVLGSACVSP